jgi:uncharacterized protein YdcH (DUF465 family)
MKITEVYKKIKKLKELLSEHSTVNAIIHHIEKDSTLYDKKYYDSLKKRKVQIENLFDIILK